MASELKPCYCGGANFDAFTELTPPEYGVVRCRLCGLGMQKATLSEAIAAWNQRPSDAVLDAARKVAEEWHFRDENIKAEVSTNLRDAIESLCALLPGESASEPKGEK